MMLPEPRFGAGMRAWDSFGYRSTRRRDLPQRFETDWLGPQTESGDQLAAAFGFRYKFFASQDAASASRSFLRMRSEADFSWPQAAKMSRPRGVRIGEA